MGRSKMLLDGQITVCLACAPPALAGVFTTPTEDEVDVDDARTQEICLACIYFSMHFKSPQATGSAVTRRIIYLNLNLGG